MGSKEEQLYKMRKDEIFTKLYNQEGMGFVLAELQNLHNERESVRPRIKQALRDNEDFSGSGEPIFDNEGEVYLHYNDGDMGRITFNDTMTDNDVDNELNSYEPFVEAERQLEALPKSNDLLDSLGERLGGLGIHIQSMKDIMTETYERNANDALFNDDPFVVGFLGSGFMDKEDLFDDPQYEGDEAHIFNFVDDDVNYMGNRIQQRINFFNDKLERFDFDGLKESLDKKYNPDDFELNDEGQLVSIRDMRANQLLKRMGLMFPVEVNDKILNQVYSSYQGGMPSLEQQLFLRPMDAYRGNLPLTEGDREML